MSSRRVIIALKGLGAMANHGVYDFERTQEQRFSADVVMWVETAGTTDDIAATVSYADIADETMAILTGNPVDLIETLAETIASRVMSHEGVVGTEVTVHKPDAPIGHPFSDVSVTVRAGETEALPLSLSLKGIYEAEDGSVLTGEIEAYGRAQAPSPAQQKRSAPSRRRRGEHAAPREEDSSRPAHLRARRVVLAIGGNLGDVPVTLMHTVEALSYMEGFQIEDVSPIMRTKPVLAPGQAPQPDYWNAVVVGSAIATPDELFAQTSRIERELGRERHERWGARSVDIDIIQVEGLASSDPVLTLPHPRAKDRAFVLAPWLLCEPDAVLEGVGRVCDLLATTPDREGIIDAVDDWLEDPAAVMADSDQLLAQRAEKASADMRELLETLTGEISQVTDLVGRPGVPFGEAPAPAAQDASPAHAQEDAAREDAPAGAEPAAWSSLHTPWSFAEVDAHSAHSAGADAPADGAADVEYDEAEDSRPPIPQPETPAQRALRVAEAAEAPVAFTDVDDAETGAVEVVAEFPDIDPAPETDSTPQTEPAPDAQAPTDEDEPASETPAHAQATPASSRPAWHPVSSVPADSPAGRMTRKIGSGTYTPSGEEKPRWAPVFQQKRPDSRADIKLPDWNFSVSAAHDVRVVDDRSGLAHEQEPPKPTVHADGRSTILAPGLPDNTPVGPIPDDEATQTGILRRVVVRPTMTGAIPIVKRH
ncbi:2-amino-4-hydroxy-6-hydroxymethyldihydropteridine diphosphokinase [Schaalia sp. HMT-172]|uniref:2-amino-4-hydroxy-6- hydroxymethyldihydropteridine diphosphokinase n=1 Tax=Schaalia sp. HMT-172 TaxID=3059028 RepID=UPI00272C8480|nr:2-amino-4-hydroxy-6-hydroxymethyldihydropteridine diphosphokinase [Schaalia sp. HMT-172]WLD78362.1 2-amino-4-hydroxy-6-hydroxymethyldihydropteridine diphosphokinase [Schaalia sp. HMT-172]